MKAHEIETAISEALEGRAAEYWNGAGRELRDEMVIHGQRHGVDSAVAEVIALSEPEESDE
jgi:hypothetical protein